MLKKDKILHLLAGFTIAGLVMWLTGNIVYAILAAILAGLLKEYYDSFFPKSHTVDVWDFVVTAIGGVLFVIIFLLF